MSSSVEPRLSETGTAPMEAGEQLGRYRLLRKIARGGMAEVYVARSFGAWGFEKTVAIKRILDKYGNDPAFIRMMVDEAKITVLLNHPNVAQIIELAEQEGDYFIVMEYVPGVSLSALSKRLRERAERIGVLEGCFIVTETLQGLQAAHEQRDQSGKPAHIIHRDVSPQNVLVSFDGHVKVIDFGIARARHRLEMTEVGTIKGKLRYLAPEMIDPLRFMQSGDFDHRVDVFAAGIVLWELIANRTLYQGDDEMAVYDAITDSDAPNLAKLGLCDGPLATIVARALTRTPDDRYPSAEAFADDLRAYLYRTDAAFTHRRVAAVLTKHFPAEKEELLALERGSVSEPGQAADTAAPPGSKPPGPKAAAPRQTAQQRQAGPPQPDPPQPDAPQPDPPQADPPSPAVRQDSTSRIRRDRARKNVVDVGDARAPVNALTAVAEMPRIDADEANDDSGQVLTVNTLVSRSDRRVSREQAAGFEVGAETVTVSQEKRPDRGRRTGEALPGGGTAGAASGPMSPHVAGPTSEHGAVFGSASPTQPPIDSRGSGPGSSDDESAVAGTAAGETSSALPDLSMVSMLSTSDVAPGTFTRGRGSRYASWLLAAASVLGIILIGLVVQTTSRPPPAPKKQPLHVVVSTSAPDAIVARAGVEQAAPARFEALPGDAFEVVVKAPGYQEEVRRVQVPREAREDLAIDVPLQAPARPLTVSVAPPDAEVLVNDQPWDPTATFPVGAILMIQLSAPGHVAVRRELKVEATQPLVIDVELRPEEEAVKSVVEHQLPPARVGKRPKAERQRTERPLPAKTGTLKVKTKPFITEVAIDGKRQADNTPITVELPAGRHVVVVSHAASGQSKSATVTVKAGAVVEHTFTFEAR